MPPKPEGSLKITCWIGFTTFPKRSLPTQALIRIPLRVDRLGQEIKPRKVLSIFLITNRAERWAEQSPGIVQLWTQHLFFISFFLWNMEVSFGFTVCLSTQTLKSPLFHGGHILLSTKAGHVPKEKPIKTHAKVSSLPYGKLWLPQLQPW